MHWRGNVKNGKLIQEAIIARIDRNFSEKQERDRQIREEQEREYQEAMLRDQERVCLTIIQVIFDVFCLFDCCLFVGSTNSGGTRKEETRGACKSEKWNCYS